MLRAVEFGDDDFTKPIVGVANAFSTITSCNSGLDYPVLCDLKPSGKYVTTDLHKAGGIPQVLKILRGGSTNAVLHLLAIAHAAQVPLTLDAFEMIRARALRARIAQLGNLKLRTTLQEFWPSALSSY